MTPIEAKKIIEDFHGSISDLRPDGIVQSSKELPYTPARIKYAHFVYGEELIKSLSFIKGETKEDMAASCEETYQEMMESYGIIDSFFNEDPEPINIKYRECLEGLKNGIITNFRIPNPFGEREPVFEYYNFFGECWFLEHHTNLFTDNALGVFIYDALLNKAIKEKDIKSLIRIVNIAKTKTVAFPGRKTNEESIFIRPN